MREQEIIQYLRLLGEELEELAVQRPVRLLMIDGAYMITQFRSRLVTEDDEEYSEHIERVLTAFFG